MTSVARERRRAWVRQYRQRPDVKAANREYMKKYRRRPHARERHRQREKIRRAKPEIQVRIKHWKQSKSYRDYLKSPGNRLRGLIRAERYRRRKGIQPRGQTLPEKALNSLLNTNFAGDWRYTGQGHVVIGGCSPDFFNVNGTKAIIEVYGCYYHNCPTCDLGGPHGRPEHDAKRIRMFEDMGYKTLVIWEHELKAPEMVLRRVKEEFYGADTTLMSNNVQISGESNSSTEWTRAR